MFIGTIYSNNEFTWFNRVSNCALYPVYLFIIGLIVMIVIGTWQVATGQTEPHMQATVGTAVPVTLFLLLKAFSSGASSLTGVEAISNAVTNFKDPI